MMPSYGGRLGERIWFRDRREHRVEVTCYDDSTDWLPLYDAKVIGSNGEVIEHIENIRGYTSVTTLARKRGWRKSLSQPK
jgi:hypothetical protein